MKLSQKTFLRGSREFEIDGDLLTVRTRRLFREARQTVDLSTLDPEPVAIGSELAFFSLQPRRSRVTLQADKPDTATFQAFVERLAQHIRDAADASPELAGNAPDSARPPAPGWNVYEEPPEFAEPEALQEIIIPVPVNADRLVADIGMLKTYLDQDDLGPLLDTLETLAAAPADEAAFRNVVETFNALDIRQGAVLTYAPYLKVLLSKSLRP